MNELQNEPMAQERKEEVGKEVLAEEAEVIQETEASGEAPVMGPEVEPEEPKGEMPEPVEVTPTQDERTMAALAHASTLLNLVTGFLGVIVAVVIWLAYRDRSPYVGFQALQSAVFQLAALVATAIGATIAAIAWTISAILTAIVIGLCLMPLALVLTLIAIVIPLAAIAYQLYAAIETYNGRDFEYRWVGSFIRQQGWA